MENRKKISLVKIENDDVDKAVSKALELINADDLMREGMKILLKPNLLMNKPPERAATTHPKVVEAVIKWLNKYNPEKIYVSDSSGGSQPGTTASTLKGSGIKAVCEKYENVEAIPFEKTPIKIYDVPSPLVLDKISTSELFEKVDLIINLPKMKTHTLTTVTLGIKNMFGKLVLANKAKTHLDFPRFEEFSAALADIYSVFPPHLTIVDGYLGMEGNGPSQGEPVQMNLIVAGYDGVAVDSVLCEIMGVDPHEVVHIVKAEEKGLGKIDFEKEGYEIIGEKISDVYRKFKPAKKGIHGVPIPKKMAQWISKNLFRSVISFDLQKCTLCGTCWKNCPAEALTPPETLDPKKYVPNWDPKKCIFCYCCTELCPYEAVEFEVNYAKNILTSSVLLLFIGIFALLGAIGYFIYSRFF